MINDFNNEQEWLRQINSVNKNIKKFDSIRKSAFDYAKKNDVIWRTKKLLSFHYSSN